MRTTVEIKDGLRAQLLKATAERGRKGFSEIVEEALEEYFAENRGRKEKQKAASLLRGQMKKTEADDLRSITEKIRGSWR